MPSGAIYLTTLYETDWKSGQPESGEEYTIFYREGVAWPTGPTSLWRVSSFMT